MIAGAVIFIVSTTCGIFSVALLLRVYLQWVRAAYRNPLSEFLAALTDFMVRPARRVIPGLWGLDLASLFLAWLIQVTELVLVMEIKGYAPAASVGAIASGVALLAAVMLLKLALYIVMVVVIVQALLSWINPYSPLAPLLGSMSRPFLRLFQRRIPPIGNVDLSPLFVIIICQLLLMLPVAYLEAVTLRLF